MESLLEAFSRGGHPMYLILMMDLMLGPAALGILALSVGARLMGKEGRIARMLSVLIGLGSALPLALGGLGFWAGQIMAEKASTAAAPEHAEEMLSVGYEVALYPLKFGGVSAVLVFGLAAAAFFLAPTRGAWEQTKSAEALPLEES